MGHCPVSSERHLRRTSVSERADTHLVIRHEKMFLPPHVHRLAVPCFNLFTLETHIILQSSQRGKPMVEARMGEVGVEDMGRVAAFRFRMIKGMEAKRNGE